MLMVWLGLRKDHVSAKNTWLYLENVTNIKQFDAYKCGDMSGFWKVEIK